MLTEKDFYDYFAEETISIGFVSTQKPEEPYFLELTPLRELMLSRTFWFSLSIVFSILYSILFLQIAFGSEYSIQDDARCSVVEFQERIGLTG
ncbi:hypothetical protein H6G40_05635 [Microcystis viridis FACHB-1342]|jgi:hypothetical protein|uniref:Uncharacterized protein n=1 Tax=Microcystis viridis FACHB-1342 TaxID=2692900 RepID=A0ABR8G8X1_MICVR|nr:hypothetical protein [Microcystis viridis FACHB-1342]